jgi:hypothetical protein
MTSVEGVVYADDMSPDEIAALLARVTPDLDAVTSVEGSGRLRALWANLLCETEAKLPDGPFRSDDFARYETPWGPVEVMGGLKVRGEPLLIDAHHSTLPIPSAQEQLRILRLFGRPKDLAKAARLEAWLSPG